MRGGKAQRTTSANSAIVELALRFDFSIGGISNVADA